MKEASGEANLTVVAIILIGVIAAVVTPLINTMMQTTQKRTCCQNNGGTWVNNKCSGATDVCPSDNTGNNTGGTQNP